MKLTSSEEDTVSISVGEMKKDDLSVENLGGNIRYYKTQLKLKPGTHWYEIEWPENEKKPVIDLY